MVSRAEIVAEARTWIGSKWQHQASLKGIACDCIGLIIGIARDLGLDGYKQWQQAHHFHGYGREPNAKELMHAAAQFLKPIDSSDAEMGDILLFRFVSEPQHFALVTSVHPISIIHAFAQARGIVEHRIDDLWQSRLVGAYRYRGLD